KRPAPSCSHLATIDLVPTVHAIHSIPFLPNTHRLVRDHAMDDFFVFGARPTSHAAASPINHPPDIIVCFRSLREIQKCARIPSVNRSDVLQSPGVANLPNSAAKWSQSFCRDCTQAKRSTLA